MSIKRASELVDKFDNGNSIYTYDSDDGDDIYRGWDFTEDNPPIDH